MQSPPRSTGANDIIILFRIIIPISLPESPPSAVLCAELLERMVQMPSIHRLQPQPVLHAAVSDPEDSEAGQLRREPARRGGGTQQHNASHIRLPHGYCRGIHRTDYPAVSLPAEIFCTGSHCRGGKGLSICTASRTTEIIPMEKLPRHGAPADSAVPWRGSFMAVKPSFPSTSFPITQKFQCSVFSFLFIRL